MTTRTDPPTATLAARMKAARHAGCVLCGGPPAVEAVWVPSASASARLGAAAGRLKTICYSVCKKCAKRPGAIARVEATLFEQAAAALKSPTSN